MSKTVAIITSFFASRVIARLDRRAKASRQVKKFLRDALLDLLEERQLLATFTYTSGTGLLAIETDSNNEAFTILSSSDNGNYTITTSGTFTGTGQTGLTGAGTNTLTIGSDIANLTSILITNNAANSGSSLAFRLSTGNFVDNLTVNFTNATTGTITVANSVSFINGASLSLTTSTNAINVSNTTRANSSGSITFSSRNIQVTGNISTAAGDIALYGNGGGSYQTGTFHGVNITGPNVNVNSTSGNITLDGRAGGGSVNEGILLNQVVVTTGSNGTISLTGVSGNGSTNYADGINTLYSTVSTVNGTLTVSGTSYGTGTGSRGVYLDINTNVNTTGTGNLSITGNAACGTDNAYGTYANSTTISTANGTLAVSGTSYGTGTDSRGVVLNTGSNVNTTGTGNLSITGNAASGTNYTYGVYAGSSTVSTVNGTLAVSGTSYGTGIYSRGVVLNTGSYVNTTGTGNLSITGNAVNGTDNAYGIHAYSANLSTVNGTLSFSGNSYGTSNNSRGVYLDINTNVNTTGTGYLSITGNAANGTDDTYGILLSNATVNTANGLLSLSGTSYDSGARATGIYATTSCVSISGTANLAIAGNAASGSTDAYGILFQQVIANTVDGTFSLSGTGNGSSTGSTGVFLGTNSRLNTSGSNNLTIAGSGFGTANAYGVCVTGAAAVSTVNGTLSLSGTSFGTGANSTGVNLLSGSNVNTTGNGNLSINGNAACGTNDACGVYASSSTVSTVNGTLSVSGRANAGGANSSGVVFETTSGSPNDIFTTGSGNLTITGVGSNGTSRVLGVAVANTSLHTVDGILTIDGTGYGTSDFSRGIKLDTGARIYTTGAGNLTMTGNAATGTTYCYGIYTNSSSNASVSTVNGTLIISGSTYGTGLGQRGLSLEGGNYTTNGTGSLSLVGLAGNNSNGTTDFNGITGILLYGARVTTVNGTLSANGISCGTGVGSYGVFLASSGNISTTGTLATASLVGTTPNNATGTGIYLLSGVVRSAGTPITLTANTVNVATSVNATTSGTVTIQTLGAVIDLGGADSSSNIGLTSREINNITAGTLIIGNSTTGAIVNTAPIDRSNATLGTNLTLISGSTITQSGGNLTVSGTANFVAPGDILLANASNNFNLVLACGTNININDQNAINLGLVYASGQFTANATGSISQTTSDATYPFSNDTLPSVLGPITSSSSFDGSQLSNFTIGNHTFGNVLQAYPAANANSAGNAVSNNSYFSIALNAVSGRTFDLTTLSFEAGKGSSTNGTGYLVRSSVDGFTGSLANVSLPNGAATTPASSLINLGDNASFRNLSSVTFRFYVYGPSTADSVDFRNISVLNYGIISGGDSSITSSGNVSLSSALVSGNFTASTNITTSNISLVGPVNATSGSGSVLMSGRNLLVNSTISTTAGDITLYGNGGGSYQTGTFDGVALQSSLVNLSTTGGNIVIDGRAGTNGTSGVSIKAFLIRTGGTGNITINGVSGNGSTTNGRGINNDGSNIYTANGHVSLTGYSNSTGNNSDGIRFNQASNITTGGTGSITLTGVGGTGGTGQSGMELYQNSLNNILTTAGGNISLYGTSRSTANDSYGILFDVQYGLNAGTGHILVDASAANASVGAIRFNGGGNTRGPSFVTNNGTITFNANSIDQNGNSTISAGSVGRVYFYTKGAGVDLGGADSTTNLGLSQNELGTIQAGLITIGNSSTGAIVNSGAIDLTNATRTVNLTLVSGNTITQTTGNLAIRGTANFVSNGLGVNGNITLNNATNNFYSTGCIVSSGTNVTIFNSNATRLGATSAANLIVNSPSGAITQVSGTGITVTGTSNFISPGNAITLNGTTNDFGTIAANGSVVNITETNDITLGAINAPGGLRVTGNAAISGITATSAITTSGSAPVILSGRNIQITGNITTDSGDILLYGNGGGVYQAGTFDGVNITGPNVNITSTSGNITLDGRAGSGSADEGIVLNQIVLTTGGSGAISLTGVSGNGSANNAFGIYANATNISTANGGLSLNGTSYGTGLNSFGVAIYNNSNVNTTGTGNLTVTGNAASGTDDAYGILLSSVSVGTANGLLSLSGNSTGSGARAVGIYGTTACVSISGTANLSITGNATGSTETYGIIFQQVLANTADGIFTLTGTGNGTSTGSTGVFLGTSSRLNTTGTNNLTITGTGCGTSTIYGACITGSSSVSTVNGTLAISGTSCSTGTDSRGINLVSVNVNTTDAGNLLITGNVSNGTNNAFGVNANNSNVTTINGTLAINGSSYGTGANSTGVVFISSSNVNTTGSGNLTVTGLGGNGTGTLSGVCISSSAVSTGNGTLSINGTACSSTANGVVGIRLSPDSRVNTTGTGDLSLTGNSAMGLDYCYGVFSFNAGNTSVSTVNGNLTINGTSYGTGKGARGLSLEGANYSTTGTGNISLFGLAASGNNTFTGTDGVTGILVYAARVSTVNGTLFANGISCGTGVGSYGVFLGSSGNISTSGSQATASLLGTTPNNATGTGIYLLSGVVRSAGTPITLTANTANLASPVNATTSGLVTIYTLGAGVNLGGADSSSNLGLTSAEFNNITAGTLVIGNATTGAIVNTAPVSFTRNLTLISGGAITQSGGNLTIGGTANFVSSGTGTAGNITLGNATNNFNMVLACGTNITIADSGDIQTNNITGSNVNVTVGGNLTVAASGVTANGDLQLKTTASQGLIAIGGSGIDNASVSGTTTLTGGYFEISSGSIRTNGTIAILSLETIKINGGTIQTPGNLTLNSANAITQPGGNLVVGGIANFVSTGSGIYGNITLNNATNNFNSSTSIKACGTNITIVNANSSGTVLGTTNATGALSVNATTGPISQVAGTNVIVSGTANFVSSGTGTSGNITLLNLTNKFGRFDARGTNISVSDPPTGIVLGNVVATGDFFANGVTGPITQAAGTNVVVAGTANFITAGTNANGNITLDSSTNDFNIVTACGTNITVNDSNAITLAAIMAAGCLTSAVPVATAQISVTGPIDATGGLGGVSLTGRNIIVTGNITTATGDIQLYGNGGGSYQAGTFHGVDITGPNVNVNSTSGNITLDGRAGGGSSNTGVLLNQAKVQSGTGGVISLTGVSGNGSAGNAYGVYANSSTVSTVNGTLAVSGTSYGTGISSSGVFLTSSNFNTTGTGNLSIIGNAACGTYYAYGVYTNSSTVSTVNGTLAVSGTSFGTLTGSSGVELVLSSNVNTTGTGNLSITGNAACGTGFAFGIEASSSKVSTVHGTLAVSGTSYGTDVESRGIYLTSSSTVNTTGTGNLSITGNAANGTNNSCGVYLNGGTTVSTVNGTLAVSGTSFGTGTFSRGVFLNSSSNVNTTGTGNILITGNAANGTSSAYGVYASGSTVSTVNGTLAVSGTSFGTGTDASGVCLTASSNMNTTGILATLSASGTTPGNTSAGVGINIDSGVIRSAATPITLTANTLNVGSSGTVNATTAGTVTIQTLGAGVDLGGADSSSNLGLTQAEFNNITAGTLIIGNASTGAIVNTAPVDRSNATLGTNLTLISGNSITQSGGNLTIGGTANFVSSGTGTAGNITLNNATNDFNILTVSGTNLTLAESNNATLNNTSISGTVNLTSANVLTVTGSYTAANSIVTGGTLSANGLLTTNLTIAGGTANVQTGGNITGSAVVNSGSLTSNGTFGTLTINNGGTLYTSSTGTRTANLTFANGSVWNASGSSLADFSKISTTGLVTIEPTANLTLNTPTGIIYGNGITLIDQSGSTLINQSTGFANLPQGTIFINNNNVLVANYNGSAGNYTFNSSGVDLVISVAPGKIQVLNPNMTTTAGQQFSSNLNIRVISDFTTQVGIPGIQVMFTLPANVNNSNNASGRFDNANYSNRTITLTSDSNGNISIPVWANDNPGPFQANITNLYNPAEYNYPYMGVIGVALQRQSLNRSYIRYMDVVLSNSNLTTLNYNPTNFLANFTLTRVKSASFSGGSNITDTRDYLANGPAVPNIYTTPVGYTVDFGPNGLGNQMATAVYDGVYELGTKAGATVVPANAPYAFHRLLGDVNGDKVVDGLDTGLIQTVLLTSPWRYQNASNLTYVNSNMSVTSSNPVAAYNWVGDVNGDGKINALDLNIVIFQRGRRVNYTRKVT